MGKARIGGTVEIGAFATHGVSKGMQGPVFVSGSFTPLTTDASGSPLNWPYRLAMELGRLTSTGWKNAAGLGHSDPFVRLYTYTVGYLSGGTVYGQPKAYSETLYTPFEEGFWDIRVTLEGSESDAQGNPVSEDPDGLWIANTVASNDHLQAVQVSAFLEQLSMAQHRLLFRTRRRAPNPKAPRSLRYPTTTVIPALIGEVPA